jgi:hypothetical protein
MDKLVAAVALLSTVAVAQTYTLTSFGTSCGGTLQGQVVSLPAGHGLRLGLLSNTPNAIAVLVFGHQATTPQPLPGGNCLLLVDPRATQLTFTDAQGRAHWNQRIPPVLPITFDIQAATLTLSPTGRVAATSNGLRLDGV